MLHFVLTSLRTCIFIRCFMYPLWNLILQVQFRAVLRHLHHLSSSWPEGFTVQTCMIAREVIKRGLNWPPRYIIYIYKGIYKDLKIHLHKGIINYAREKNYISPLNIRHFNEMVKNILCKQYSLWRSI